MVAIAYTDVAASTHPAHAAARMESRQPMAPTQDPVDTATRLLSIPLRQVYAWLWRAGVLEIDG